MTTITTTPPSSCATRARSDKSLQSMPESSGDDGDTFGSLLSDASRAGASEPDRLHGATDGPGAVAESAIDQPGGDRGDFEDVHQSAPSQGVQPGRVAPDQALVAAVALISPYPAVAPEINVAHAVVPATPGSCSGQCDLSAATGERSTTVEPVGMQPGLIPLSMHDASSLGGQPVALMTQTGLQGEFATGLQGELATGGELATETVERSDAAGATTTDDDAIQHGPDPIEAGEASLVLTASTRDVGQPSGPSAGARLGFGNPVATGNGRQASIDEMVKQAAIRRLGMAGRLGLDIRTDRLGSIRLEASETSSGLQLNFGADRASTRTMLSHELAALRADLGAGHDVQVDLGARSDTPHGRDQPDRPSRPADVRPSGYVRPIRERDAALAPRRASILALDALDLRL